LARREALRSAIESSAQEIEVLRELAEKVIQGDALHKDEALSLSSVPQQHIADLLGAASMIRTHFRGNSVDLCAIINAKSGACPEDCTYCAQSSKNSAAAAVFPLVGKETIIEKAGEALQGGAKRFCIVTSGRKVSGRELRRIADAVSEVRALGLLPCATLGLLSEAEIRQLKASGLERYHHNLETSDRYFPMICSTHTYRDKMETIGAVRAAGVSLCCGGIFGLGETWQDRVDMAFALKEIAPDSVPLNFLTPIKGTSLGSQTLLEPFEALKIIALFRFVLPDREIRVCGGRMPTLRDFHSFIFLAGADALLTGNYLTTTGRRFEDDLELIRMHGLTPDREKHGQGEGKCSA
jgi:biotin synthase